MKSLFSTVILCGLFAGTLVAQKEEAVLKALQETPSTDAQIAEHAYNKTPAESYQLLIHAEERPLEKALKDFVETQTGAALKRSKGYQTTEMVVLNTISTDSLMLIAELMPESSGVLVAFMANKKGTMLNMADHPAEMKEIETLLEKFSKKFYTSYYKDIIADKEKNFDKAQKDVEKLTKRVGNTETSIAKAKDDIKSEEVDIKKEEDDKKSAEAEISKLETDKETLQREITRLEENIERNKVDVNTYQSQVDELSATGDTEGRAFKKAMKNLEKAQKNDMSLYEDLQGTHEDINKLDGKISKEQGKLNDAESDIRKHENKIKELQNDIKSSERELKDFQSELKSAEKLRDGLQSSLDKLRAAAAAVPEM